MATITYLFGYGSLICPHSRAVTCPELKERESIPVILKGIERTWSKRSVRGMTAMGVRFNPKAQCAGILVPLESESELEMFDNREKGYERKLVSLDKVRKVPFLKRKHMNEEHDDFFEFLNDCLNDENDEDEEDGQSETPSAELSEEESDEDSDDEVTYENIEVWVYVPIQTLPPTADHPIAQSYVDTILRGCIAVGGEEFAAEFLETTAGWNPEEWDKSDYKKSDKVDEVWINDRESPVYLRGDPEHSLENAPVFDSLIEKYRDDMEIRVDVDEPEKEEIPPPPPKEIPLSPKKSQKKISKKSSKTVYSIRAK